MTRLPVVIVIPKTGKLPTRRLQAPADRHDYTPKQKPNPLTVAQFWLGNRLEERPLGYFLDSSPATLDAIMRETNRVLKANGVEQVGTKGDWLV